MFNYSAVGERRSRRPYHRLPASRNIVISLWIFNKSCKTNTDRHSFSVGHTYKNKACITISDFPLKVMYEKEQNNELNFRLSITAHLQLTTYTYRWIPYFYNMRASVHCRHMLVFKLLLVSILLTYQ